MARVLRHRGQIALGIGIVLGLVFTASGLGKLLGQEITLVNLSPLRLPPLIAAFITDWLPWIELVVGLCLLTGIVTQPMAVVACGLSAAFIVFNSWMIANGHGYKPCLCLGVLEKLSSGKLSTVDSLYIDIGLFVLAVLLYFSYSGGWFNLQPWFARKKVRLQ